MSKNTFTFSSFSFEIQQSSSSTYINMTTPQELLYTDTFPHISQFLEESFPSVLETECFNDNQLAFSQEVCNTEMGHFFEHVLLEYLCQVKLSHGHTSAIFSGRTFWNWKKDKLGVFHIFVDIGTSENKFLQEAFKKSVTLMELLLRTDYKVVEEYTIPEVLFPSFIQSTGKSYNLPVDYSK